MQIIIEHYDVVIFILAGGTVIFVPLSFISVNWKTSIPLTEPLKTMWKKIPEPEQYKKHRRKWRWIYLLAVPVYGFVLVIVSIVTQNLMFGFFIGLIGGVAALGIIASKEQKARRIVENEITETILEGKYEQMLKNDRIKLVRKITKDDLKKLPWWTWVFIVLCAVLPVATLGGAMPVLMAILGIILCISISSYPNMTKPLKLLACFGVTALAWGIAWGFLYLIVFFS